MSEHPVERVVYLLGAGFSAPLGLPVVSNFLAKSKDMFAGNPEKYAHFKAVYDGIRDLNGVQTYLNSDMLDIEEVLSIIEMREVAQRSDFREKFLQYIIDVINHHTPPIPVHHKGGLPRDWYAALFGPRDVPGPGWEMYGFFVASLFNLRVQWTVVGGQAFVIVSRQPTVRTIYDVITVNYDIVLETAIGHMKQQYQAETPMEFLAAGTAGFDPRAIVPWLSKLHGSVDKKNIIPPTWNKVLTRDLSDDWALAYESLRHANHIRIIGYSLPATDSYIRYLLKAALASVENLKTIDVLCLDDGQQTVERRYRDFIRYRHLRFRGDVVEHFLVDNVELVKQEHDPMRTNGMSFDKLEKAHERTFAQQD